MSRRYPERPGSSRAVETIENGDRPPSSLRQLVGTTALRAAESGQMAPCGAGRRARSVRRLVTNPIGVGISRAHSTHSAHRLWRADEPAPVIVSRAISHSAVPREIARDTIESASSKNASSRCTERVERVLEMPAHIGFVTSRRNHRERCPAPRPKEVMLNSIRRAIQLRYGTSIRHALTVSLMVQDAPGGWHEPSEQLRPSPDAPRGPPPTAL